MNYSRNTLLLLSVLCMMISNTSIATSKPYKNITTTLSYLFGGEQDFRNTDHSTYLTNGIEMNNLISFNQDWYVALDNIFAFAGGFYYLTNPYTIPNKYLSTGYKYVLRGTVGRTFALANNKNIALGIGAGYRHLRYNASYDQAVNPNPALVSGVNNVAFIYNEFYIPLEVNFNQAISDDISWSFNNIFAMGINGLANHVFSGPGGFTQPSFHYAFGYYPTILLNYKQYSFGPFGSFDYFTLGKYNGTITVPPGNQLKIVEFGLKASYNFLS